MFTYQRAAWLLSLFVLGSGGFVLAQLPFGEPGPPEQMRAAVRTLYVQVNHLVEDFEVDLQRDAASERLMAMAQDAEEEVEHLAASVERGASLQHAAKDFQAFDAVWHRLTRLAHTAALEDRHLQKNLARIAQTDAELHGMLRVPVPVEMEQIRGLSASLYKAVAHLREDIDTDLWELGRYDSIWQVASDTEEVVEHFATSAARGGTMDHLRRDFREVDGTWRRLAGELRGLSLYRYNHVNQGAARVAVIEGQLGTALGLDPNPAQFSSFRPAPTDSRPAAPYRQPGFGIALPLGWRITIPLGDSRDEHREGKRRDGDRRDGERRDEDRHEEHEHSHDEADSAPVPPKPLDPKMQARVNESLARMSAPDRVAATAQRICPVSGELLGSDGVPIKVRVKDSERRPREVFLCCEDCQESFQKNPAKYLQKLAK